MPDELGVAHGPFMLQLMLPMRSGHQLTLTLGTNPTDQPGTLSFLLDLYDVVLLGGRDAFGDVQRLLDQGHENIIHTFENTITDMSRRLFGEIAHA